MGLLRANQLSRTGFACPEENTSVWKAARVFANEALASCKYYNNVIGDYMNVFSRLEV